MENLFEEKQEETKFEFKDLFDIEKIEKAKPELLLEETLKSILDTIILNFNEMNELAYQMPGKADYEKVSGYIDYQKKENDDGNKILEITVPVFDERKLQEFQVSLFDNNKIDVFPERGFYVVGDSKLIAEPLGLVKIEMGGLPITPVSSDYRFTRPSYDKEKGYREYLYFYYDYENNKFVKVYSDKLEECKHKMKNNPKAINDYHVSVQEYINRETLLSKIKERIYPLSLPYLKKLKVWSIRTTGASLGSMCSYFEDYKKFIEEDMVRQLKIKLLYANVTKNEYHKLLEKQKELLDLIQTTKDEIDEIKKLNSLTDETFGCYVPDVNSLFKRETEISNNIEKVMSVLRKFKEVRPSEFPKYGLTEEIVLKGYLDYNLEKNEVYPNIMQLQRRTSLTEEKEDFRSEEEYVFQILDYFKPKQA